MVHHLKTVNPHFSEVWASLKTFEIRGEGDRDFNKGDTLVLMEFLPENNCFSGRKIEAKVTHILRGKEWGIMDGYCILSINLIQRYGSN